MPRVPADERRAELVQAAIQVATREGLAATTTRRIAQELGISVGDRALLLPVQGGVAARGDPGDRGRPGRWPPARRSSPGGDLPSSVRNAFLGFWKLVEATPEAQLLTYELTSWALRNAETEPLAREQRRVQLAGIEADPRRDLGGDCGVTWSVPPEQLARMTLAITDGVTLGWLVDRDTTPPYRCWRRSPISCSRWRCS